jgi:hypothetical protein
MRTTLTIDDDNAVRLERLRKERDASLKDVVNDAIRRGLDALDAPAKAREPFKIPVLDLGPALIADPKEALRLLDEEDDLRKLGRSR